MNGTAQAERIDALTYHYTNGTNRLSYLNDAETTTTATHDLKNQSIDNYAYNANGQLTKDEQGEIGTIAWTAAGKVWKVTRTSGSTKPDLEFLYDAAGNRLCKIVKPRDGSGPLVPMHWTRTWYVPPSGSSSTQNRSVAPDRGTSLRYHW